MQSDHNKRVVVTVVAVAIALAGSALMLPGVPGELLDRAGGLHSFFPPKRLRVLSLGITPYLSASSLWLLLSGVIGRLGRRRDGTAAERAAFDQAIVWLALIIASVQGLAYGLYIQNLLSISGLTGRGSLLLLVAATVSAGTAVMISAALFVTRAGVGNGVAWIALATSYLAVLPASVPSELARLRESSVGYFRLPLAVAALVGLVVFCCFYLRSCRDVALVPVEGRKVPLPRSVPPLPLRINLTGIVPVAVATALMSVPATLSGLFPNAPHWFVPAPPVYWTLFAVLTVVLSYVFAGIGFDTRRVAPMLERFGYRIDGVEGQSAEEYLDKLIEKRILLSAAFLIGIALVPGPVLEALTGISLSRAGISGEFVLVACAVVLDAVRNKGTVNERAPDEEVSADSANQDSPEGWVAVLESDVEFETRLALTALEARGIRGVTMSNRVIPLTGTFAYWEWTVPTYPFLVIHRRLGGGKSVLRVPEPDAGRAREVLAELAAA